MNKRDLIIKIYELDKSCSASYLATFCMVDLQYHWSLLQQAHAAMAEQEPEKELIPVQLTL